MRALSLGLVLFAFVLVVESASRTAIGGVWSDPNHWCPVGVPEAGDDIVIPSGADVMLDVSTPRLGLIDILEGGRLRFNHGIGAEDNELHLQVETVLVRGYLEMGREDAPLERPARVTLITQGVPPPRTQENLFSEPYGTKMIAVIENGIWEAHAVGRSVVWTHLEGSVSAGDSTLTLSEAVDWRVGDRIIVTSTDYNPEQTEERFVASVAGNQVTLDTPLSYGHFGRVLTYSGYDIDMRAEVAVLTSNLVIMGDMTDSPTSTPETLVDDGGYTQYVQYGGHTISTDSSFVRLSGVEFFQMGQGGRLARYPVHWHHRLDAPGQYMQNCMIHHSYSRGISIHDTNQLLVRNNVMFYIQGHAVYFEDGTEVDNIVDRNLVVTTIAVGEKDGTSYHDLGSWKFPECGRIQPGIRLQFLDNEPSGFWVTNVRNTLVNNVAVGTNWGFWIRVDFVFSEPLFGGGCTVCCEGGGRDCECTNTYRDAPHFLRVIDMYGEGLVMENNFAHSNIDAGIWIKENWTPRVKQHIRGFTAYKNKVGMDLYGLANLEVSHFKLADNAAGVFIEWTRFDDNVYKHGIIVGESENHGNPDAPLGSGVRVQEVGDSLAWPSARRTYSYAMAFVGQFCFRFSDGYNHLEDVVFYNCIRPTTEWSSNEYTDDYMGDNYQGAMMTHLKHFTMVPPDRDINNVYFVNSPTVLPRSRGVKYSSSNKDDECLPRHLAAGGTSDSYGSGFHDVSGSLPCSEAGAYWLSNTPGMVPEDGSCEFRSAFNMYYCAPFAGIYQSIELRFNRGYDGSGSGYFTMDYECGKVLQPWDADGDMLFGVRTDKVYQVTWRDSANNPQTTGVRGINFIPRQPRHWVSQSFVVRYDGLYDTTYYLRRTSGSSPHLVAADGSLHEEQCRCGVTWVRVTVLPINDPSFDGAEYLPDSGFELHADENSGKSCPASPCGNPWAPAAPTCTPITTNSMAMDDAACLAGMPAAPSGPSEGLVMSTYSDYAPDRSDFPPRYDFGAPGLVDPEYYGCPPLTTASATSSEPPPTTYPATSATTSSSGGSGTTTGAAASTTTSGGAGTDDGSSTSGAATDDTTGTSSTGDASTTGSVDGSTSDSSVSGEVGGAVDGTDEGSESGGMGDLTSNVPLLVGAAAGLCCVCSSVVLGCLVVARRRSVSSKGSIPLWDM